MQRRTGGSFSRLLASLSPVPADPGRYPIHVRFGVFTSHLTNPYSPPQNSRSESVASRSAGSKVLASIALVGLIAYAVLSGLILQSPLENDRKAAEFMLVNVPLLALMAAGLAWSPRSGAVCGVLAAIGQTAVAILISKHVYISPSHVLSWVSSFVFVLTVILGLSCASLRLKRATQ
ncbi:hypothetical protein CA13_65420 [Planctomycetes bacterium CA13]|uniref:Uncharacterized protein n=1 Tax=Novipirellula herctigrandis TaxID=2527986 RepID=A0A5C5ZD24_9BACT|nr:hypothetical protein CA13_65420 [Planctomycetes bacterium CA13]